MAGQRRLQAEGRRGRYYLRGAQVDVQHLHVPAAHADDAGTLVAGVLPKVNRTTLSQMTGNWHRWVDEQMIWNGAGADQAGDLRDYQNAATHDIL